MYGGSVNADDVRAYLSLKGCDGVLVGAASLNYLQFASIVNTAYQLATERE
ncbi:MAG: triose-phosphate isomerase [Candidatus Saccharimonadales bacterium]